MTDERRCDVEIACFSFESGTLKAIFPVQFFLLKETYLLKEKKPASYASWTSLDCNDARIAVRLITTEEPYQAWRLRLIIFKDCAAGTTLP